MDFPFPSEEETFKYMEYIHDSPLIQRINSTVVVNPEDLGIMAAKFQMIASSFVAFLWKEYKKLHEKCAIDVKKLVGEKAGLEKRLSSVTKKLNREMQEVHNLNSKLNLEMEEVSGLNLKLNHEMEELHGRNSKVSNRLVELGGEIEVAREESEFLRSKNERLCSKVEQARVENERLRGLVDGFETREHAIKLEGVNEFASGPRFYKRVVHHMFPAFMGFGQMGVDQMAKIAGMPSVPFKVVQGYKYPSSGHYKIPKLGEVVLDNEHTLEAWNVTELYHPKKKRVSEEGLGAKRKATDLVVQPALCVKRV